MRKTFLYMKSSSEWVSDRKQSEQSQMCFGRNSQKKGAMEKAKKTFVFNLSIKRLPNDPTCFLPTPFLLHLSPLRPSHPPLDPRRSPLFQVLRVW